MQSSELDAESKQDYPLRVLKVMKRHAEDLIWAKNLDEGISVLRFIKLVTAERDDARELYKGNQVMLKGTVSRRICSKLSIGHFTVVCLVTWPLSGSEAGGDLVLIQTLLLFTCKSCCSHAN